METEETMTIQYFREKYHLRMDCKRIQKRSDNSNEWSKGSTHYRVTIDRDGAPETVTVEYSQGAAFKGSPLIVDVLDCLASDASGVENSMNFEGWAAEYGYDTDSRKAERVYMACIKIADDLKKMLGPEGYNELLYHTERM